MNKVSNISSTLGFPIKSNPEIIQKALTNIESYIANLPKDMESILKSLSINTEKISSSAYKLDHYVLLPEKIYNHTQMMSEASMYMNNNPSILQFVKYQNLSDDINLYIYKIGDETQSLIKYNEDVVTDKAKQDFYYNMKELTLDGKIDTTELLDQSKWYMTKDGQAVYHISLHLNGHVTQQQREKALKQLFDTLFNKAK